MASSAQAQVRPDASAPQKSPAKIRAGQNGMRAVLEKYAMQSPDWARDRAARGGTSTRSRYGRAYYQFLANRRWSRYRQQKLQQGA